ncbi:MAG: TonB-dependent receptor [Alphaproteobacteria bacterium]|nr:TonB-dependent receptor [Alphaproteobacteria bacterium]
MSSCVRPGCAGRVRVTACGDALKSPRGVSFDIHLVSPRGGFWNVNQEAAMRHSLVVFCSVLLGFLATPRAFADDVAESVVVTATRTPQPAEKTGESVSILTGTELDVQQIVSVTDALEKIPGIVVVRNGGLGQNATASIRGAEVGQTLVLVDGIRINDPSTVDNQALLGDVLVNNIDRIEILRGPQGALYGSDAIGGVIDILTRRGGDAPFALRASGEGGSFGTYRFNTGANGSISDVEYGAAANFLHSGGISAADSRNGNPEADAYTNAGATENVRVHLNDAVSVDLRSYYTNTRDDFDDNFVFVPPATFRVADSAAYGRNTLLAGYAGLNLDLLDGAFGNRLALIGSDSHRAFYNSAFDIVHKNSSNKGIAERLEYQGIVKLIPEDELTFGAEYQRISFQGKTFSGFGPSSSDSGRSHVASFYAQNMLTLFEQLTLTAGLRHDDDREFGGHNSVKLAAAWSLNEGDTVLHANYGDGFKAPTLFEQFSDFSNPMHALRPEVAHGWEFGASQRLFGGAVVAKAAYFERHTNDQIDFFVPDCFSNPPPDVCKVRPFGYYDNIKRTEAKGVEIEAMARLGDTLALDAAFTDMTSTDRTTDLDLARRPHITASATATWTPLPDWTAGATLLYVGKRFDAAGEINPLPANTVVNVFASHRLTDWLELYARAENLFDAHYEPVFGYGAPGRAAYGGIRLSY